MLYALLKRMTDKTAFRNSIRSQYMQRMLNEEEKENVKVFKKCIPPSVLRTCDSIESISLRKFTQKKNKINK